MKNVDSTTQNLLVGAPRTGIVPRKFIWATVKDRDTGAAVGKGFWNGDEDVLASFTDGITGAVVERLYRGAGELLSISSINKVSDFTLQTVTVDLSQVAPAAQDLIRLYECRLGKIQIYEVILDPTTRLPSSSAILPSFIGEIDGAPISTPASGGTGSASLKCVSDAFAMLTRTSPRKSSYQGQRKRSGDEWGKYSGAVSSWDIKWSSQK